MRQVRPKSLVMGTDDVSKETNPMAVMMRAIITGIET